MSWDTEAVRNVCPVLNSDNKYLWRKADVLKCDYQLRINHLYGICNLKCYGNNRRIKERRNSKVKIFIGG